MASHDLCSQQKHVSSLICSPSSCLWQETTHVSLMSFPKPGLSINYGQDEIWVPVGQPIISTSRGDQVQKTFAAFLWSITGEGIHQTNQRALPCRCSETVNNKEEIHQERNCKITEKDRKTTEGLSFSPLPVASSLSWQLLIPGLVLVCSPWRQLGNQVEKGHRDRGLSVLK